MDIFDKCYAYNDADIARQLNIYPYFRAHHSKNDTVVIIDNKEVIMLGSNSYLGLTSHPEVKEAAMKAIEEHGTGCAGSRFLNGTLDIHEELEKKLAKFVGKEDCIIYSTGFFANQGCISALAGRRDYIILDKLDHASIIEGARLGFAKVLKFKHNDISDLERILKSIKDEPKMIVVDGVYSMDGDIAPLPEIVELCQKYKVRLMVDDAHSLGVLGPGGRGTAAHFNLTDKVDIIMGTFSKSLASQGGFIAGDRKVIDYIRHTSRPFIFSASLAPALVAAASKALDIMIMEPERIKNLWDITNYAREGFLKRGFDIGNSITPIIPIKVGDRDLTLKYWRYLADNNLFVNPVLPPAVQPNQCIIRTSYIATHTKDQIDYALDVFEKGAKLLGIIN